MNIFITFFPEIFPFAHSFNLTNHNFRVPFDLDIENFDEKRMIGENDDYICELIRKDSIQEFVRLYFIKELTPKTLIPLSIFETNQYLLDKDVTLLDYAAFQGSVRIFIFLMNKAKAEPETDLHDLKSNDQFDLGKYKNKATASLLQYAIHSNKQKITRIIEQEDYIANSDVAILKQTFLDSIKFHHISVSDYICNYFLQDFDDEFKKKVLFLSLKYSNYHLIDFDSIRDNEFILFCGAAYCYDTFLITSMLENVPLNDAIV